MGNYCAVYDIHQGFYIGLGGFLNGKLEPVISHERNWLEAETPESAMGEALELAGKYAREKIPHPQTRRVAVTLRSLTCRGEPLNQDELVPGRKVQFLNRCAVVQSHLYRKKDIIGEK